MLTIRALHHRHWCLLLLLSSVLVVTCNPVAVVVHARCPALKVLRRSSEVIEMLWLLLQEIELLMGHWLVSKLVMLLELRILK